MKKQHNIIIPKPCKENWNEMTETERGRFCAVCSKNLIDFTDKSRFEIEEILSNPQEEICGRFNTEQLDSVHIEIPEYTFRKQYSFAKAFAIALLLVMGTTLLSCNLDGKTKKIETVTVVENANKKLNNDDDNDGIPNEFDVYNAVPNKKNDLLQKRKDSLLNSGRELIKQDSIERENRLKKYKSFKNKNRVEIPHFRRVTVGVPVYHSTHKIPKIPLQEQFKQDIALVALGRKKSSEITKHFCDSNPKITVNHRTMTFSEFYEKVKGRKIEIRKLRIYKKDNNCINTLKLHYKGFFIKNDNSLLDKKPILKKKDTIVKQINSSKAVSPKAKDTIKKN